MKAFFLPTDEDDFADIFSHPKVQSAFEQAVGNALQKHLAKPILPKEDELMDVGQAAKYLGLAKATLYEKTSTRQIPFMKAGDKKLIFKRSDLDKWLESGRRKTQAEIRAEAVEYVRTSKKRR